MTQPKFTLKKKAIPRVVDLLDRQNKKIILGKLNDPTIESKATPLPSETPTNKIQQVTQPKKRIVLGKLPLPTTDKQTERIHNGTRTATNRLTLKPLKPKIKINQPAIPIPETETILARAATESAQQPTLKESTATLRKAQILENAEPITQLNKSSLSDDSMTFDDSQLAAVELVREEKYMCLIGSAGTGKTTVLKKAIDGLMESTRAIDLSAYWKDSHDTDGKRIKEQLHVPSICICAFTGQAVQMVKKTFPKSWHPNIMTIHRMLNYKPEYYDHLEDSGEITKKMRFTPSFGRSINGELLPWDIIIMDEAGMCAVDLWERIEDSLRPETQIKLVGDINQLPPVHGKPILAHGMLKWPVAELTTIHRQKGKDNPIVDNAWRILRGEKPQNHPLFNMFEMDSNAQKGQSFVRQIYKAFRNKTINGKPLIDPDSDVIITPINGDKISDGAPLGQIPLNDILAAIDLKDYKQNHSSRYLINAGREKKPFAVGDRVMATKNDYEIGITNGMMGEIVEIADNGDYHGTRDGYGILNLAEGELPQDAIDANPDFKIDMDDFMQDMNDFMAKGKEAQEAARGQASHTVTVRFGPKKEVVPAPYPEVTKDQLIHFSKSNPKLFDAITAEREDWEKSQVEDKEGFFVTFSTFAEVCSLQLCYAITCHKSQGAEFDTVVIVLHSTHSKMLYREWLYTAVTRAKQRVILLYTDRALATALGNQRIGGATLKEKIRAFAIMANINPDKQPKLPEPIKMIADEHIEKDSK